MEQDNSFNYKKSWIDLHKGRGLALLETSKESSIAHFNAIVGYSKIAINGALLLNGTAGIAILYNVKQLPKEIHTSLCLCAIGAVFAVLCAGLSYITQRVYAKIELDNIQSQIQYFFAAVLDIMKSDKINTTPPKLKKSSFGHILSAFACLTWIASVSSFSYAVYIVFPMLSNLPVNQ